MGSLSPEGPVAARMADLWWLMLALGVAVFIGVMLLLFRALRRRSSDSLPPGSDERRVARWIVGGGVVLPLVVIVVVMGATIVAMRALPTQEPPGSLPIEITGHQWWWEVHYPESGFTTANEVHIPVGRPVALRLKAADVIHSFWVPSLGGKIDMLPERTNLLVLEADRPGEYPGGCAEFCGLQHARMKLVVVAEPAESFESWVAAQSAAPPAPATPLAAEGAGIFATECSECHTVRGTGAAGTKGPDLTHFAGRSTIGAGTEVNDRGRLESWVRDPHVLKEGVLMPAAELPDDRIAALVAYLETLR